MIVEGLPQAAQALLGVGGEAARVLASASG
jgi:hypothetical protein